MYSLREGGRRRAITDSSSDQDACANEAHKRVSQGKNASVSRAQPTRRERRADAPGQRSPNDVELLHRLLRPLGRFLLVPLHDRSANDPGERVEVAVQVFTRRDDWGCELLQDAKEVVGFRERDDNLRTCREREGVSKSIKGRSKVKRERRRTVQQRHDIEKHHLGAVLS